MGVPAFFRWLSRKYPSIVVHCVEEKPKVVNGVRFPVDSSQPNPNNFEFDNLYLDMNGIIHPCCHPENKPAPKNEDEMMIAIFEYIDRIFSIVRPRRVLYMAIDGVAPRAKMNQQRSRRFRASKESAEKVQEMNRIREELKERGAPVPPEKQKEEHFDSNCITPGTPFMARLAKCLHYYIHDRMNNDPGWKNIKVILSDANVPGEGEHKIMDYIRRQRANPSHDPNTRHCLCGADADLIMLGLATHEPNFTIIREEFKPNQPRPCDLCGQIGHELKDCQGLPAEKQGEFDELEKPIAAETEFIFLRLNVLREYLERELSMPNLPFPFDLERAIDDWVFMCFFVGNDFLPHLPSLEIREGAIDRLVNLYKKTVYKTGGYLTDSGLVNLHRVQLIMSDLGDVEDEIFKRRQQNELNFRARQKERKKRQKMESDRPAWTPSGQFAPTPIGNRPSPVQNARHEAYTMRRQGMQIACYQTVASARDLSNLDAAHALKAMLQGGDTKNEEESPRQQEKRGEKRKHDGAEDKDSDDEEPHDEVRLWEDGWKERYYEAKFEVSKENIEFRYRVAAAYVQGLCWVLRYYYQGCASWKWFFPYHYAPFASDFVNIGDLPSSFEKGTQPFKPLEQLMGVFPAASKQHLPEPWGDLMDSDESPIIDFYPTDFKIDLNGKKYAWQGVALLPFVDEKRLLDALKEVYPLLTPEERKRNVRGDDRLYVRETHSGFDFLLGIYESCSDLNREFDLNPDLFQGVSGKILVAEDAVGPKEIVRSVIHGLDDIPDNRVICIRFRDPKFDEDFIFPAKRLPGAQDPPRVLRPTNLNAEESQNWRPQIGMAPARQRASLDAAGARMLQRNLSGPGQYSQVPPPMARGGNRKSYPPPSYGNSSYEDYHYRSSSYERDSYNYQAAGWQRQQSQHSRFDADGRQGYQQQQRQWSALPPQSRSWDNQQRDEAGDRSNRYSQNRNQQNQYGSYYYHRYQQH